MWDLLEKRDVFFDVVKKALEMAKDSPRWVNAIEKAREEMILNPFIMYANGRVKIFSSKTGGSNIASPESCTCDAHRFGKPCYHRALAQLLFRYFQRVNQKPTKFTRDVLVKPTDKDPNRKKNRIGGIDI